MVTYNAIKRRLVNGHQYAINERVRPEDLRALKPSTLKILYQIGAFVLGDDSGVLDRVAAAQTVNVRQSR